MLPFTFNLDAATASLFFVAIYSPAEYGGSIDAILIRTPGTSAATMTLLDGYPMALQGKAIRALKISLMAEKRQAAGAVQKVEMRRSAVNDLSHVECWKLMPSFLRGIAIGTMVGRFRDRAPPSPPSSPKARSRAGRRRRRGSAPASPKNLLRGLAINGGDLMQLLSRPITFTTLLLSALTVLLSLHRRKLEIQEA